jgi:hypothetical protein
VDGGAARIRLLGGSAIERSFKPRDEGFPRLGVGMRQAGRRHLAGAQFAKNLLPGFGGFADVIGIHVLNGDSAGVQFVVVTRRAILIEECARGGCNCGQANHQRKRERTTPSQQHAGCFKVAQKCA